MAILCCCRSAKTTCRGVEPSNAKPSDGTSPVLLVEWPDSQPNIEQVQQAQVQQESSKPILHAQAPSRLNSPTRQAVVDPTVLNVEDTDDEDANSRTTRPRISMLEAIKIKFAQSIASAFKKRRHPPPTVVGNSQGDLERRAELKRLMHQRIRDELRSERETKDDTTSADHSRENKHAHPNKPNLAGSGLRDTIEFSAEEMNEIKSNGLKCNASENVTLTTPKNAGQLPTSNQNSSNPASTRNSRDTITTEDPTTVMAWGSLSRTPASPEPGPIHASSLRNSYSTHSWHLDYSAEQLTSILGIHEELTKQSLGTNDLGADTGEAPDIKSTIETDGAASCELSRPASPSEDTDCLNAPASTNDDDQHFSPEPEDEQTYITTLHEGSLEMWLRSQDLQPSLDTSSQRNGATALSKIPESYTQELEGMSRDHQQEPGSTSKEPEEHQDEVTQQSFSETRSNSTEPNTNIGKLSPELVAKELPVASVEQPDHGNSSDHALATTLEEPSSHCTSSRHIMRPESSQQSRRSSRLSVIELFGGSKHSSGPQKPYVQCKH